MEQAVSKERAMSSFIKRKGQTTYKVKPVAKYIFLKPVALFNIHKCLHKISYKLW